MGRSSSSEPCLTSNEVLNSTSPVKMPLKLRPTGIGCGINKDCSDYTILRRRMGGRPHLPDARRSR